MSEQEQALKLPSLQGEGQPAPQFPMMQVLPTKDGIEVTIVFSSFLVLKQLIPTQASDQVAIEWLARRPPQVDGLIAKVRHKLLSEQMLVQDIVLRGNKNGGPGRV